MKILLENKYHYRKGGSETYYFALAEALIAAGHQVVYFAMQDENNFSCEQSEYFVSNVEYNCRQTKTRQLIEARKLLYSHEAKRKFEALIKVEKPDVVHLNLIHRQITLSIVDLCEQYNIPVIFTLHDLVCACPRGSILKSNGQVCYSCWNGKFINCLINKCIKGSWFKSLAGYAEAEFYRWHKSYEKIGLYITPSDAHRVKLLESNFTKQPIIRMRNFLPLNTIYTIEPTSGKYILYLGALNADKGVMTLLKAYEKANITYQLLFAGKGMMYDDLKNYVIEHGMNEKVKFLGFISGKELRQSIANAYAVVIPSECFENGPYSIMEAMAAGKPIIGSNIGGIPELIIEGETGYCFEPGSSDDLSLLLKKIASLNHIEYTKMCDNSLKFAKDNFTAEKYITKLLDLYNDLIKRK